MKLFEITSRFIESVLFTPASFFKLKTSYYFIINPIFLSKIVEESLSDFQFYFRNALVSRLVTASKPICRFVTNSLPFSLDRKERLSVRNLNNKNPTRETDELIKRQIREEKERKSGRWIALRVSFVSTSESNWQVDGDFIAFCRQNKWRQFQLHSFASSSSPIHLSIKPSISFHLILS